MNRKTVCGLLCAGLLLNGASLTPLLHTVTVQAEQAAEIEYDFIDGTAYVKRVSAVGELTVPSTVTDSNGSSARVVGIYADAFRGSSVSAVKLPETLTQIGDGAFADCVDLKSVDFSSASVTLGNKVFSGDTAVELTGTENILYVGSCALDGTTYAEQAGSGDVYIGKCLYKSTASGHVTLKDGTLSIAPEVFADNTDITSVSLGDKFRIIGDYAFSGCTSLSSVDFGSSLTEIGTGAFESSGIAGNPNLPDTLEKIGAYAFSGCSNLTEINLLYASKLTSLPNGAFYNCTSLESAALPFEAKSIGDSCFAKDARLSAVYCGYVEIIGKDAFRDCAAVSDRYAFTSAKLVGAGAFEGTAILANNDNPELYIGNVLYRMQPSDYVSLMVTVSSVTERAAVGSTFDYLYLSENVMSIGEKALPTHDGTTIVSLSESEAVYRYFDGLSYKKLYLPIGVTSKKPQNAEYITGIELASLPTQTTCKPGKPFDDSGISVKLVTENGEKRDADFYSLSYNFYQSNVVTVRCGKFSTSFTITVLPNYTVGDLDGNGSVDSVDLLTMRQYLAGLLNEKDFVFEAADTDGNGSVDSSDLLELRRMLTGL